MFNFPNAKSLASGSRMLLMPRLTSLGSPLISEQPGGQLLSTEAVPVTNNPLVSITAQPLPPAPASSDLLSPGQPERVGS